MDHPEMQCRAAPAPSPSNGGECSTLVTRLASPRLLNACFCHPGDYCQQECISLDKETLDDEDTFKLNISSGEDAFT